MPASTSERLTTFVPGTRAGELNDEFDNVYSLINGVGRAEITQANSFSVGQVVGFSGGIYALADADAGIEGIGIVESADSASFTMVLHGVAEFASHGWTLGWNWVSETPGGLTATPPPPDGTNMAQKFLFALDANTVLVRPAEALGAGLL